MGKKQIHQSAMDELMGGLVQSSEENLPAHNVLTKSQGSKRGPKPSLIKKEHLCSNISTSVMDKVRTITVKEGINISEVVEAGLLLAIKKYESKYGKIEPMSRSKKNAGDLFGL